MRVDCELKRTVRVQKIISTKLYHGQASGLVGWTPEWFHHHLEWFHHHLGLLHHHLSRDQRVEQPCRHQLVPGSLQKKFMLKQGCVW